MSSRRNLVWLLVGCLSGCLLFLFSPVLAHIDAGRDAEGHLPLFCWSLWTNHRRVRSDGGTEVFEGFGYHFVHKHRIVDRDYQVGDKVRHESGVIVHFYVPGYWCFDFETTGPEQ